MIRSLAPSKRGKRPLLSDISNNLTLSPIVSVHQVKKKNLLQCQKCRNTRI